MNGHRGTGAPPRVLGVDTGGTFTDFAYFDGAALYTHKVLSTPQAPEQAVLEGIAQMGLALPGLRVVHGSTVATNAVLEGRGARTAFVTNRGLADLLTIGRQTRRALYDLVPPVHPPPVPAELCLETGGRRGADGAPIEPLTDADLAALRAAIVRLAPEAVAVCLLFSYLDDSDERRIEAALPADLFVSRSGAVLAQQREYERGIATWLNACVGPRMQRYLGALERALAPATLAVMQSSGLTCSATHGGRAAVHLLLSGPAGGLEGARHVALAAGHRRLLTFDMGGTSTDVAVIDGGIQLTGEGRIGDYPVAVPMVDMHTIGAGGGSIAWVDAGGALQVGPQSAGAAPGPVCYGRGGRAPTVTDANLVAGRLPARARLAGGVRLDADAAQAAFADLAVRLHLPDARAAAQGVIRVANEKMARALRVVTVERGLDPRGFVLTAFGGAGGLHACDLAEALGIAQVFVPAHLGVLSALGMVVAAPGRMLTRTLGRPLDAPGPGTIDPEIDALCARAADELMAEGVDRSALDSQVTADLRYRGQSSVLTLPWRGPSAAAEDFHALHRARYGHRLDQPVELVNLRVAVHGPGIASIPPPAAPGGIGAGPVFDGRPGAGRTIAGPAVILEPLATVWIAPGWTARADAGRNLLLQRGA
ncbi:MAG: hydantoinase/oxoprolinase family protein [Gammaproteobacteria bacterium]